MNNDPPSFIDVIIPAYNCMDTIETTIASIQNSNLPDYSIIIIDDGSSDHTRTVCKEMVRRFHNIRYFYQDNAGVSAARNKGIQEATGEYILFVDSDDLLMPFSNEIVDELIAAQSDVIIFGMTFEYYRKNNIVRREYKKVNQKQKFYLKDLPGYWDTLFSNNYLTPVWNKFFRRSMLINGNILFDLRLTNYEDLAFSLNALSRSKYISVFSEPYYKYALDYDHDHTVDRISKINDIMTNTDYISHHFLSLERSITQGNIPVYEMRKSLLNIYFEIFRTKLKTMPLTQVNQYCLMFLHNSFISENSNLLSSLSAANQKLYHWISQQNVLFIWLNSKYYVFRHFIARNIKFIFRSRKNDL